MSTDLSLTRRKVSAIARTDFTGLSHAQRIEAVAQAIGFETAAALMGSLKAAEAEPLATSEESDQGPFRIVIAAGSDLVSTLLQNEAVDEHAWKWGNIIEKSFATKAEVTAYINGFFDGEGWLDARVLASEVDDPDNAYFAARAADPSLDYRTWHDSEVMKRAAADGIEAEISAAEDRAMAENRARPGGGAIVGYQVDDPQTGECWGGRWSSEILDRAMALSDLRSAFEAGERGYRLLAIREGDVEDPDFLSSR